MRRLFTILLAFICLPNYANFQLELLWTVEGRFNMPESAAFDAKRNMVYVSNVNHYAKDNNGFISRVSADGQQVDIEWLTGLNSPTGLTVHGDKLYAVDFDALVIIDLISEKILKRIPAVDADSTPALNDVAVANNGDVYVTGSRSRTIYKMENDSLMVWLKDDQKLLNANGLFVYGSSLLYGGQYWHGFDIESKKQITALSKMGKGLVDIDGITNIGNGQFIATLIDDDRLWLAQKGKAPSPLTEDKVKGIDLSYDAERNILFIPRVGNSLSAYRLIRTAK